jgi:hypothetical protein
MAQLRNVILGGTFRPTWVSSGVTAAPITYNILTGSETLVSSYAGVSSGGGHYYVDAMIDPASWSPGLYQAKWIATVNANTHVQVEMLQANPYEADEPGRYVTYDDIVGRYAKFSTVTGGAVHAASHYISFAEAMIDGLLADTFTVPFSSNNLIVKDLTIDLAYLKAMGLRAEDRDEIRGEVMQKIEMLKAGTLVMVTSSGDTIATNAPSNAWSSTEDYHPVFAMLDEVYLGVSSEQIIDEGAERGFIWN